MKATELQINDWVYSSFFGKTRVTSLKEHVGYGWVMTSESENWKSDASLSPIPLTAEIWEKNGHGQDMPRLSFAISETGWCGCDINYVHEYQHALRLCGLNDLADNFRV